MSVIIHEATKSIESQSHRAPGENWNGEGWLPVPEDLEKTALRLAPYCELEVKEIDGERVIVKITATEEPYHEPFWTDTDVLNTLLGVTE